MNGLETAIRSALARSDRSNAETRARIYQSARQALETGLRKQNITDPRILGEQRQRLEQMIQAIEQQELAELGAVAAPVAPAAAPAAPVAPSQGRREPTMAMPAAAPPPKPQANTGVRAEPRMDAPVEPRSAMREPSLDEPQFERPVPPPVRSAPGNGAGDLGGMKAERDDWLDAPATAAAGAAPVEVRADRAMRQRKPKRRIISRLFVTATLLAGVATAGWWVYSSGLLTTAMERATSTSNPPPTAEAEDFTGGEVATPLDPQQGFSSDWISVFEPDQSASISAHEDVVVEPVTASDGRAVRITSRSPDEDGEIEIPVPVEVMRDMVGKTSTIALTLQAAGDNPVQISVDCNFDMLGSCPRHRFTLHPEKSDVLLRVAFDQSLAPSKPGILTLNGDIAGGGQAVNLYSVRVLPGQ